MQLRQTWSWAAALVGRGASEPDAPVLKRNIRLLYWDVAWFGLLFGISANFLTIFIARLNASPWLLSIVTSGPALVNVLWQLPAARIVERSLDPKRLTLQSAIPQRLVFLLIVLIPFFLPLSWQAYAIVTVILLQGIPTAIMFVSFQTLFTDLVPRTRMAAVVGTRNALMGLTSTIMVIVCGFVLTMLPFPLGYQALFFVGFLASLGSIWCVSRLRVEGAEPQSATTSAPPPVADVGPAPAVMRDRNFLRFALSAGTLHLGMFMTAPLFPLYWVGDLGLGDGWISAFVTTLGVTSILGAYGVRAISHRWHVGVILGIASFLFGIYPIMTSMAANPILLTAIAGFAGIWGGVINVMLFNAMTEVIPPRYRPRYIGIYTWMMNIAIFAGPILGAALAEVTTVQFALIASGFLRVLAGLFFVRLPFRSWDQVAVSAPAST
jgi:MFS family permease